MNDTVQLPPLAHERLANVLPIVDKGITVVCDAELEATIARVRMKPGDRLTTIVRVLLALGYTVRVEWDQPHSLGEWLEAQVVERRNLGPHTRQAALAKASGLSVEESAALLGWSKSTVITNLRAAEDRLDPGDWADLATAAGLMDTQIVGVVRGSSTSREHMVQFDPQPLPAAAPF